MMKKRIGISVSETSADNYFNWFTPGDLKADIELVRLSFDENNVEDMPSCDGFVLTGGIDVDPSYYNGENNYPNRPKVFSAARDGFEKYIYQYSQIHSLPLLAICRGLQMVNVLEGGSLIQDLADKNAAHKKDTTEDKNHIVKVSPGSLLYQLVKTEQGEVNSAHHQAVPIGGIAPTLALNATSEKDSVIEGLEFRDKGNKAFMLAVQWHPERMKNKEENPLSKKLKDAFLDAIRDTRNKKLSIINPATEDLISTLNVDTKESVTDYYDDLKQGQKGWKNIPISQRVEVLNKFSYLLLKNIDQLARVLTDEMGKPLQQSKNEINGACTRIKWITDHAEKYLSDEIMTNENGLNEKIAYEPLGVIANISAWNYPYLVGVNVFVPALLAGNAVLYKPSEYASLTGLQIENLLKQAGVPTNVFHVAIGKGDVGAYLPDLPLDGYFFTGSYKTGKYLYEKVAAKMVPCQCELGGKDPLYIAGDVKDINSVAAATADGAFYNNGQSCCAVERIYVHENIYDQYVDTFINEVKKFKAGQPTADGIYIGPLSRKEQINYLEQQVKEAVSKGAKLVTGGKRMHRKGYYFEPTVLLDVTHDMSVMTEESFGPVIGIMKVKDDKEAVSLMEDTEYGLTAAVYSSSRQRAETILQQLNTGTGYWNCCDRVSAAVPWSGRKHSGIGATLSHAGIRAFVKPKSYHLKEG
jgi:acyl-CoA reductase-like NAD-dependent aldehyde dehydrogenase/anthranilate/para-aminobenzoate synthase component II